LFPACRSSDEREDSLEELQETLRSNLLALSESPEERERLLAIFAELETLSSELVDGHIEFIEELDRLSGDRSVSQESLQALLETNLEFRARVVTALLTQQDLVKSQLGPERWSELVSQLNDAERMQRMLGKES